MPRKKSDDRYSKSTVVLSVSMHGSAKDAAIRIAEKEGVGVSELIRAALSAYANTNGHKSEAQHFDQEG